MCARACRMPRHVRSISLDTLTLHPIRAGLPSKYTLLQIHTARGRVGNGSASLGCNWEDRRKPANIEAARRACDRWFSLCEQLESARERASRRALMSRSLPDSIIDAAVILDLDSLRRAVSGGASVDQLSGRSAGGITIVHGLAAGFHFFKAGELSGLVPWPNASRTVYAQDVRNVLGRAISPVVRDLLSRAPSLATAADDLGATGLHLAARYCVDDLVYELLRAGGSPSASNGLRTPIDEATMAGCTEALALLLGALPRSEQPQALAKAAAYTRLPGSALSQHALSFIVRDTLPHLRSYHRPFQPPPTIVPPPVLSEASSSSECKEGGGWDVEPPPSETERSSCEIEQVSADLSADEFRRRFYELSRPVLVRGAVPLSQRCAYAKTSPTTSQPWAASTLMRCGRTAYPSLTGQRPCGTFTLRSLDTHPACGDAERTLPVCALKPHGSVNSTPSFRSLPTSLRYADDTPPAPMLSKVWVVAGSRQMFAGGRGSGAAMHFHNPAYNVQLFGVKRWLLTPPRHAGITGAASTQWPHDQRINRALPPDLPLKCTQGPGDMMIVPGHWGHATVNSGFTIGTGNLYCDGVNANYTHDPSCRRFFPRAGTPSLRNPKRRVPLLQPILLEALGGKFAKNGAFRWPQPSSTKRGLQQFASTASSITPKAKAKGVGRRPSPIPAAQPPPADCNIGQKLYRPIAFVHINKAGGTAMRARLYKAARHQLLEVQHSATALPKMRSLGSRFFHASASLQRKVLTPSVWDNAYTFALVRNPYARQVSMFFFLLQEAACNKPIGVRPSHCETRKLPAVGPWLKDRSECITKFRKWIRDMHTAFPPTTRSAHLFGSRSHGNEIDPWFNASQLSWLVDGSGKLLVNEVIKLEELESAWPKLQSKICGFGSSKYGEDAELRRNPSSHGHYSEYYDESTKRMVEAYVAPDLKAFGYVFEQHTGGAQPPTQSGGILSRAFG